jgi:hypothetical protein
LTTHWAREDSRRYFVLPDKAWRIVGAEYKAPAGVDF